MGTLEGLASSPFRPGSAACLVGEHRGTRQAFPDAGEGGGRVLQRNSWGGALALIAVASLGACDAKTLAGLAAQAAADGGRPALPGNMASASTMPGAAPASSPSPLSSSAPAATASPASSTAPTESASPGGALPQAGAHAEAVAHLKEMAKAKEEDPVAFAKLVVQALAYAMKDVDVATEMLAYLSDNTLKAADAKSSTGFVMGPTYLRFMVTTLEKEPYHAFFYTPSGVSPDADWKTVADKVLIDEDYKAVQKGVEGNYAYYYFKVRNDLRSSAKLTLSLGKSEAGPKAWRANNLSSLYVAYGFPLPE